MDQQDEPPSEDVDAAAGVDVVVTLVLQAVRLLRPGTKISEGAFRNGLFRVPAKAYALYDALDEIEKAALCLIHMKGMLAESGSEHEDESVWRNTILITLEPLRLRVRRMAELLVSLVLFESTDEEDYHHHKLLLHELQHGLSHARDMERFHEKASRWFARSNELVRSQIEQLETKIDLKRAWYRRGDPPKSLAQQQPKPGAIFSTFGERLARVLPHLSNQERVVLGGTYGDAYGLPSSTMHYGGAGPPPTAPGTPQSEAARISMLALLCVQRARQQIRPAANPVFDKVSEMLTSVTATEGLFDRRFVRLEINVGDYVHIRGFLAQVIGDNHSALGYRSFEVEFLAERPIPEIDRDWFPAREVRPLANVSEILAGTAELLAENGLAVPANRPSHAAHVRSLVLAAWHGGMRDAVHRALGRK